MNETITIPSNLTAQIRGVLSRNDFRFADATDPEPSTEEGFVLAVIENTLASFFQ